MTEAEAATVTAGSDPGKQYRARTGIPIVPALDGFRAFAILGIVLLHLLGVYLRPDSWTTLTLTRGFLPNFVDVLFILSGFVVFLPTVVRGGDFGSVKGYAIRRAARLMPAYWLVIAIVILLILIWPSSPGPVFPTISSVGIHALGLHEPARFFDPGFGLGLGIDGPLWTLSLELTFYLVLPFVASLYFRRPLIGLLIAMAITVAWKLAAANIVDVAHALGFHPTPEKLAATRLSAMGQFPSWAFQFGLGMTAAWAMVRLRERYPADWLARRAAWVQGASLLVLIPLCIKFGSFAKSNNVIAPTIARTDILLSLALPAAIASFMLATTLAPRRLQLPFALPGARALGDVSYGIYLIHFPAILFVGALLVVQPPLAFWTLGPIVVVVCVAYGWASAHFVEQPIRTWAHRFGRRAQDQGGSRSGAPGAVQAGGRR